MRIELGVMERVLFIFLFLYGIISFASMIVHMHVALEFLKETFGTYKRNMKQRKWFANGAIVLFAAIALLVNSVISDPTLLSMGTRWLQIRFYSEALLVALTVYAAWRRRKPA